MLFKFNNNYYYWSSSVIKTCKWCMPRTSHSHTHSLTLFPLVFLFFVFPSLTLSSRHPQWQGQQREDRRTKKDTKPQTGTPWNPKPSHSPQGVNRTLKTKTRIAVVHGKKDSMGSQRNQGQGRRSYCTPFFTGNKDEREEGKREQRSGCPKRWIFKGIHCFICCKYYVV